MRLQQFAAVAAILILMVSPVLAGWLRWTYDVEKDPFSSGQRLTISYSTSQRSGVFVFCDTSKDGIELRPIAGWHLDHATLTKLNATEIKASIAVDGKILVEDTPSNAGICGDAIACTSILLDKRTANKLVDAFIEARKQIAIKDGISDRPHLLTARGSTKAARELKKCLYLQSNN